jgi:hypothetical protein
VSLIETVRAMMHDPELYGDDHLEFRPERHEGLSEARYKETEYV